MDAERPDLACSSAPWYAPGGFVGKRSTRNRYLCGRGALVRDVVWRCALRGESEFDVWAQHNSSPVPVERLALGVRMARVSGSRRPWRRIRPIDGRREKRPSARNHTGEENAGETHRALWISVGPLSRTMIGHRAQPGADAVVKIHGSGVRAHRMCCAWLYRLFSQGRRPPPPPRLRLSVHVDPPAPDNA